MTSPGPCQHCGGIPTLRPTSDHLFARNYGPVWECPCGARVGCHRGTTRPLGTVADARTRAARMGAHKAFDRVWRAGRMKRTQAYADLAKYLGINFKNCHIGMFDVRQCERVRHWAADAWDRPAAGKSGRRP